MSTEIGTENSLLQAIAQFTIPEIIQLLNGVVSLSRTDKRRRSRLVLVLQQLNEQQKDTLLLRIAGGRGSKRQRLNDGSPLAVMRVSRPILNPVHDQGLPVHVGGVEELLRGPFLELASREVVDGCISRFIDRTSNQEIKKVICLVCARRLFQRQVVTCDPQSIPNLFLLAPTHPHPAHELFNGALLHGPALRADGGRYLCLECRSQLLINERPRLSLANNMWLGEAPFELLDLGLAERLLIGLYFPAVYVVKLFPKGKGPQTWDEGKVYSGVRGNVSTYRLASNQVSAMVTDNLLPHSSRVLSATIGVTFVGFKKLPLRILPQLFDVRRHRVRDALCWLKANNPFYHDIQISEQRLAALPVAGVPQEIALNVRYEDDSNTFNREQGSYIPEAAQGPAGVPLSRNSDTERDSARPTSAQYAASNVITSSTVNTQSQVTDEDAMVVDEPASNTPTTDRRVCSPSLSDLQGNFAAPPGSVMDNASAMLVGDDSRMADRVLPAGDTNTGVSLLNPVPKPEYDFIGLPPPAEGQQRGEDYEPSVFLQPHGTVDVAADSVTDSQLFASAVNNLLPPVKRKYGVRPGSAFVSEWPRTVNNLRTDGRELRTVGDQESPNHLLGAFPVLFPYGTGGFEVDRRTDVPYEQHVRWALEYDDSRFRKDFYFVFLVFGVLQKRLLARSATLQIHRSSFIQNQVAFQRLRVQDFVQASREEAAGNLISNPVIRGLRQQLTAVRARVHGTDESRIAIRAQVWGMTLRYNPPTIWATLNLADMADPIAQVLAGQEIDLDHFCATAGKDSDGRSRIITADPFAAAEFFHICVRLILEEMFGILSTPKGAIQRKSGILGVVNGYIGTVEAQARGTLHLHLLLWLRGAPVASVMKEALKSEDFRLKMKAFISANICAHIEGTTADSLKSLPTSKNLGYSRPPDPRQPNYDARAAELERNVARSYQWHDCLPYTCLRPKAGRMVCKRRAPWPTADEAWVMENGEWGPKRLHGLMNAWNPALLQVTRCNQDMKIITNGAETKDITFYITLYIAKRQIQAANASALLAKAYAYKPRRTPDQREIQDINRQMLERCVNILNRQHEFSAPEVISYLMGWGDRFISHTYVRIYWDVITAQLRRTFPHLRGATFGTGLLSTMVAEVIEQEQEQPIRLTRDEQGFLVLRDQLREYRDRGLALEDMNFFDYFTDTYDGKMLIANSNEEDDDEDAATVGEKRKRAGRPASQRVPYLPGSGRKRCRVVRGAKQEVNLHFVGKWFPRNDVPGEREYYCAQMLLLFKPWRRLGDLASGYSSFDEAFQLFISTASTNCLRILDNLQYFYDCSDQARKRREAAQVSERQQECTVPVDDTQDRPVAMEIEFQEEDVRLARSLRYAAREEIYGEGAMATAFAQGIFSNSYGEVPLNAVARQATAADMSQYHEWGQRIAAYTRSAMFAENNGLVVGGPQVDAAVFQDEGQPEINTVSESEPAVEALDCEPTPEGGSTQLLVLNEEQALARDLVVDHLRETLAGRKPPQLLMIIRGEGGTGKTVVLNAIAESFASLEVPQMLAKTATTGVAASLFGGQTLHNWAAMGIGDLPRQATAKTQAKRERNMGHVQYLIIDEFSMMTKKLLAYTSDVLTSVKFGLNMCEQDDAFGGINIILVGDLHQFPPIGSLRRALFYTGPDDDAVSRLGLNLFHRFTTVVTLTQQRRITDPQWTAFLRRLRVGECTKSDLDMLRSLRVDGAVGKQTRWGEAPWNNAVLVTPRHSARIRWNTESLRKHQATSGHRVYRCQAEDRLSKDGGHLGLRERVLVAQRKTKQCGRLAEHVQLAIGMRAMVLLNISTEAELANGTRGEIVDIVLDVREPFPLDIDGDTGETNLQYPPALVLFKPDNSNFPEFEGLGAGIIPIVPSLARFSVPGPGGGDNIKISRRQLALTPAYAFTDYKSQGQTIHHVVIDLEPIPTGALTPFSAYVAMSRSHGRDNIRILRGFDNSLFTHHPSTYLQAEDQRLDECTLATARSRGV